MAVQGGLFDQATPHEFGGAWTEKKLEVLRKYLPAYLKVLKYKNFSTIYIDGFAGTRYRTPSVAESTQKLPLFPELEVQTAEPTPGSAVTALRAAPGFDKYYFIERTPAKCADLERLKLDFPDLAQNIEVKQGDANERIQALCRSSKWQGVRGVLFLDPYGMQVDWETIEAVARTRAIDLWLLFPLGMGLNRVVPRHGEIPTLWRARIDAFLGTSDWYDDLYPARQELDLFGPKTTATRVDINGLWEYFRKRLESVFAGVLDRPMILMNSARCPLFVFVLAVGNDAAKGPAFRIASSITE